jgi:hypothetical protein
LAAVGRDLDLPRLRPLGDRDPQPQDTGVVVGRYLVQVEVVPEHELAAEQAGGPLGSQHLALAAAWRPFGLDGQHVPLDVDVQGLGLDAGQVELDQERVAVSPGIHRHHGRTRRGAGTHQLLCQPVELTEGVGAHQHDYHLHSAFCCLVTAAYL